MFSGNCLSRIFQGFILTEQPWYIVPRFIDFPQSFRSSKKCSVQGSLKWKSCIMKIKSEHCIGLNFFIFHSNFQVGKYPPTDFSSGLYYPPLPPALHPLFNYYGLWTMQFYTFATHIYHFPISIFQFIGSPRKRWIEVSLHSNTRKESLVENFSW